MRVNCDGTGTGRDGGEERRGEERRGAKQHKPRDQRDQGRLTGLRRREERRGEGKP